MKNVTPKIFVVAETVIKEGGLQEMLNEIGATDWKIRSDDSVAEGEVLIEVGGRLCYKSFDTTLNKNLTRVREGNYQYIGNILKQKHGSVLEHATVSIAMINVSRVFTHELVRHRAGMAYSQESMRFVRMDDIPMWIPDLEADFQQLAEYAFEEGVVASKKAWGTRLYRNFVGDMRSIVEAAEERIASYTLFLDKPGVPFDLKKKVTSALRRMAPHGHATNILATGNHRAWRHEIAMRTAFGAEEEIRIVYDMIARDFRDRYPAIYQDMAGVEPPENSSTKVPAWVFANEKV